MNDLERRVETLEKQVRALTTALQLTLVAAKPVSEWLDAQNEQIDMRDKVARAKK
jgi:hypothetical protein